MVFIIDVLERSGCHDQSILLGSADRFIGAGPASGDVGEVAGWGARQGRVPHVDQERALVDNLRAAGGGGQGGRR